MTTTTDAHQHPDISEISDLTEGLLSSTRTTDLRHHLAGCDLCSDVHTSLEEIRTLLGTLPSPQQMPDDVVGRIDAALSAAASSVAASAPAANSVSRETEGVTEECVLAEPAGTLDATPRDPAAEPAVTHRPSGRPRGATGPGRRPAPRRRRTAILGAAFGAAVVGMSALLLQSVQSSQDAATKSVDRSFGMAEDGGQSFSEGTLEGRVDALLSDTAAKEVRSDGPGEPSVDTKSSPNADSPNTAASSNPLRMPTVPVPPCVQQGTGRVTPALAVEQGRYRGKDAFLVVLPHPTDTGRVQAYVVDAACVGSVPAAKGRLLLSQTYTHP